MMHSFDAGAILSSGDTAWRRLACLHDKARYTLKKALDTVQIKPVILQTFKYPWHSSDPSIDSSSLFHGSQAEDIFRTICLRHWFLKTRSSSSLADDINVREHRVTLWLAPVIPLIIPWQTNRKRETLRTTREAT